MVGGRSLEPQRWGGMVQGLRMKLFVEKIPSGRPEQLFGHSLRETADRRDRASGAKEYEK